MNYIKIKSSFSYLFAYNTPLPKVGNHRTSIEVIAYSGYFFYGVLKKYLKTKKAPKKGAFLI
jgi:hypothetical protein